MCILTTNHNAILYVVCYIVGNDTFFEVNNEEIEKIKKIHNQQCPQLFGEAGSAYFHILTIGYRKAFDYLLLLVHDYQRDRAKHIMDINNKNWTVSMWSAPKNHQHFYQLGTRMVKIPKQIHTENGRKKIKYLNYVYRDVAAEAVKGFKYVLSHLCWKYLFVFQDKNVNNCVCKFVIVGVTVVISYV